MRIGILQGAFLPVPPIAGGAVEKMWFLLGQEFAARGHRVFHISSTHKDLPPTDTIAGVSHLRIRGASAPKSVVLLKLLDFLYTFRARRVLPETDVLVTNTFFAPIVLAKHSGIYVDVARMPKGQIRLYRRAARLRANSSPLRAAILKEEPLAESRTSLIPNPLPFSTPEPVDWSLKEKRILYAGRVHPEKGISLLLDAFLTAKARGHMAGWKLEIVGPAEISYGGGGAGWFAELLKNHPHPDVSWLGPIFDSQRLNEHYRKATLFVYPSLAERGETFGLAPLEAMAWGAVPIVSDLACFKDFVRAGINGFTFHHRAQNATNVLADVFSRATQTDLKELRANATNVRSTHSLTHIAEAFLTDFERVVDGLPAISAPTPS
ncbi:MAG TPA: glycosyltransferase family 4 protein [Chthoniobacterales bacterium]